MRRLVKADLKLLGEGMEGAVYEIDDARVAKFWHAGSPSTLARLARFYTALKAKSLPFAAPEIIGIELVSDQVVTIERRLAGTTMAAEAPGTVVDILADLALAGELPAARELSVLGEEAPLYAADEDLPAALAALAADRCGQVTPAPIRRWPR